MKQHECKKGTIQNKYGLFSAQIIARGWGSEFYDLPTCVVLLWNVGKTAAPLLSAAPNASYAVYMGLWNIFTG